jgi:outer membrane protein
MKKYLLLAVTAFLLVAVPRTAHAQTKAAPTAVAHLDLDSLLGIMPAFQSASDSAQLFYADLEKQMYAMNLELQRKGAEYDSLSPTWSKSIKTIKEQEIYDLQQRIQAFQQTAQDDYTKRRSELLVPLFNKIQAAVKDVAVTKGYAYVLDSSKSATVVLYAAKSADIFVDVQHKLGIPDPKPKPAPAPGGAPTPPGGGAH